MIRVSEPLITENQIRLVTKALTEGWSSSGGPYIQAFEENWAAFCGRKYGVCVANGSVALHIALASLNLPKGSEVILPSFTIISCGLAVTQLGLTPVFVDCDRFSWNMQPAQVEEKITERTAAIMLVHIFGQMCKADEFMQLAEKHNLYLVEDAAQAHGARYKKIFAGSVGDMSCFSFYANKIISTGEGGMVLTNDEGLFEELRNLRNLYFDKERKYIHHHVGYNYRMTTMQAAMGIPQINDINALTQRKSEIHHRYKANLKDSENLRFQQETAEADSVYWMNGFVLETTEYDASFLSSELLKMGIETRHFFTGLHRQPALGFANKTDEMRFPVTEHATTYGLYLPSGLALKNEEIDFISEILLEITQ